MNNRITKSALSLTAAVTILFTLQGCGMDNKPPQTTPNYETLTPSSNKINQAAIDLNTKGLEQLKAGDTEAAEKSFKAALDADISCGPAHNNLGSIYFNKGELYLAAWEFQYAAKLSPNNPKPHNNLGLVYHQANKLKKAKESFEKALKLNPNSNEIKQNLKKVTKQLNTDPKNPAAEQ